MYVKIIKARNEGREIGYRIIQTVTPTRLYIEWEGLFATEDGAREEIRRVLRLKKPLPQDALVVKL